MAGPAYWRIALEVGCSERGGCRPNPLVFADESLVATSDPPVGYNERAEIGYELLAGGVRRPGTTFVIRGCRAMALVRRASRRLLLRA